MNARGPGPYGWMLCGCVSFSLMVIFSHAAALYCDWQIILLARASLVMLFAGIIAYCGGIRFVVVGSPTLWLRSFAGSVSMLLTFYAVTRPQVPPGYVVTLTNLFPVWVALLSWPLLGEMPQPGVWLAVAIGVFGVGVMKLSGGDIPESDVATWMGLGASLCSAVAMLGLHRLRGIDPLAIVVHFSAVATVGGLVCFALLDRPRPLASVLAWQPVLLLLGIGLSATFGQWCLTLAFTGGEPSRVSVIGLSQVVFVMVIQTCLGEALTVQTLAGTLLVLIPTAWVMLRRPRARDTLPAIVTAAAVVPPGEAGGDIPAAEGADAPGGASITDKPTDAGQPALH